MTVNDFSIADADGNRSSPVALTRWVPLLSTGPHSSWQGRCRRRSHALRAGFTIEEILNPTKIGRWFLVQIKEIVDFEEKLTTAKN